ncbi:uncharacterized protein LOC124795896 [Schistocerca piceifrons]|uniref:uncharacterized protein LOC124795896 n=1 Tax=Schistocerca piceifrons TaxID=274613 RepID=UPI001F5F951C|nr:uncharacterized protein LOC124795896 [Schistocerca piceifrons]
MASSIKPCFLSSSVAYDANASPWGALDFLQSDYKQILAQLYKNDGVVVGTVSTPSLLPALNTTVPVNVAARPADLAQRHAPTRSSLRHSRLVSKAYQQELDPQRPRAYRSRRLACALSGLELLLGLSVCMLALWLLLWAPRMRTRDVPYWSGAPLFLSGLCGLTLAGCPGDFPGSCIKFFRVVSIILAIQAALSCLVAAILSMMHLILLHWAQCEPESALSTSCECHTEMANILRYPDLSCPAVVNVLVLLLVGSCASNLMGCILAAWLLPLHWGRYRSHGYLPVASRPPS